MQMRAMTRIGIVLATFAAMAAPASAADPEFTDEQIEFFEKRIRPVLADNCHECHSRRKQRAELRLDSYANLMIGSDRGAVVVPGKPDESRLVEAIHYEDPELQMPPDAKLPDEIIADLTRWVEMGVPWPDEEEPAEAEAPKEAFRLAERKAEHWAWQPIKLADPPAGSSWARSPIDCFIEARLTAEGMIPAVEADRRTLIRRAYFDLAGLPPSAEAVEAFVADESDEAFERVIDNLLASPRFGERWGRHWLDLTRYAESYGHEQDYPIRNAWRYRDYVIRAINDDLPYDRFVTEHFAGDLLENPRINPEGGFNESIIGTGFWHMHQATHAPVDVRQDEADRFDNMIDVMSKTFLGVTVACARCHDHKFDAISTKDYYALSGFFHSSRQQTALLDTNGEIHAAAEGVRSFREKGNDLLAETMSQSGEEASSDLARYLLAAHEVIDGEWRSEDGDALLKPEILFEDFEGGRFENWIVEGEAFGDSPRRSTASSREGDNDTEGRLTSKPFIIERSRLRYSIAGGDSASGVSFNFLVDGEIVRSAPDAKNERAQRRSWDVGEFIGKPARLEIIDAGGGQWGHIAVDNIVFAEHDYPEPISRPVGPVAEQFELDAERLERWVRLIQRVDPKDDSHPLHAWLQLTASRRDGEGDEFEKRLGRLAGKLARRLNERDEKKPEYIVHETFDGEDWGEWTATGEAFGDRPTGAGDASPGTRNGELPPPGVAHSGLNGEKFAGVLRSPNFTILKKNIHYRMAGRRGKIRLVIEGYQLREFNGLLFGGTLFDVNTGGRFIWHNQTSGMAKFVGRSAYIELIDDGDGYVAVDEIRFSDGGPEAELIDPIALHLAKPAEGEAPDSMERLAEVYEAALLDSIRRWPVDATEAPGSGLLAWMRRNDLADLGPADELLALMGEFIRKRGEAVPEPVRVLAMLEGTVQEDHVMIRGSHKAPGELAPRALIEAIAGADQSPIESGSGRLELARRILADDNPLTARVMVNRVWHHLFGRGIVGSVDNFGVLGEAPTHPELLDFLAARFRSEGWSLKQLIREIMLTSTYQMSSRPGNPEAEKSDPANLLVHRMNVRRLEAEAIRDTVLAVSGRLDTTMYGEPVPIRVTDFMDRRNKPKTGPTDGNGRRSIYMTIRRNYLSPMMLTFDAPMPDTTIGRRTVSNVPAQSLLLMNDPFVVEQTEVWANKILAEGELSNRERIVMIYHDAFGRPPTGSEVFHASAFIRNQGTAYGLEPAACGEDARVWADLCHVVITLKEFIFVA